MRAVNLIPDEQGRAAGGSPRRAWLVLGALTVLVALVTAWTLTDRSVAEHERELSEARAQAAAVQARARQLSAFTRFAKLGQERLQTVNQVIDGRVDWAHALHEVAGAVPAGADLLSVNASAAPGGGGPGASTVRAALGVPAVDIVGCATGQRQVARLLARLRAADGVERVSLSASEKSEAPSSSDGDCRTSENRPQFGITVFFGGAAAQTPVTGGAR